MILSLWGYTEFKRKKRRPRVIFKYLLILIFNIIPENRLCMISVPLDHEIFALVLCPWIYWIYPDTGYTPRLPVYPAAV